MAAWLYPTYDFINRTLSACAEWGTLCSSHLHETSFVGFFHFKSIYQNDTHDHTTSSKNLDSTTTYFYILTYSNKSAIYLAGFIG